MWDDLVGLWVGWRRRRGWRCGQDFRISSVQVLDALFVIVAQPQRVGEGVVGRHDGSRHAGVLQAQYVPELMGCNLEEVCACRGVRQTSENAKPHVTQILLESNLRLLFWPAWSGKPRGFCCLSRYSFLLLILFQPGPDRVCCWSVTYISIFT